MGPIDVARLHAQLEALRRAGTPKATERGYAHDWRMFTRFCERLNQPSLPASPETLALFLVDMLSRGRKVATAARYASGVAFEHKRQGIASPLDESVRQVLRSARRQRAEALEQMSPLSVEQLRLVAETLSQRRTRTAIRNHALVVVGFATALRRANLASLQMEDVAVERQGVRIWVRHEKNDRAGEGRFVDATAGGNPITCPVRTLEAWLEIRGRHAGPVFTRLDDRAPQNAPLSLNAIGRIVKEAIRQAGIDGAYCTHSLRAGLITEAGVLGVNHLIIAATSGHRSLATLQRYFRPRPFATDMSKILGL